MPTVDNLDIQISAQVTKANASLTTLINRLDRVSASLMGVNSRGMATMGSGVNKLTNSMQNFSNATKTADFSRLARNLSSIGSIDGERVKAAASGIQSFAGSLGALNKIPVSESSLKIAELAKGISQLGYKSSTQAIDNIPKLATAMSQLMRELSKAPVVSRNLIDMTNALAKLSRTGASSGRAANSLGSSLDRYTLSTTRATKGTFSLASALGKLYATYWLLFRSFRKIGDAINIASDLYEVQNVVDVTFGNMASKVEEFAQTSIKQFGMSELTLKQVASQFQAMGAAMSIDKGSIANAQKYLNAQTNGYVELSDSMADVSLTLTKLTADMASFYNVEQEAVAEDLQSIFTGQTKPLRQYGVDLTEVNLKQWAMTQGLNSNIDAMTQAEKTMLRYQYVLAHTGAAQGDFARTSNSWANQVRILRQQFEQLGAVIGKTFIAALKPLINALNNAMSHIIAFAQTVSNALGKIFGWKFEVGGGGVTTDLESGADYADDLAGGMSDAAQSAKKLKSYLLGIDELNVIEPVEDASAGASGGGGTGGGGGSGTGSDGGWSKTDSIFKDYESDIDTLYKLGEYIGKAITDALNSIDWESVYESARNFGKGLAEFLNGLISPALFGAVGRTIAGALNTAIYAALAFGETFDFYDFGVSIATGINEFFETFDFTSLAKTLNVWVDGLEKTIVGFLDTIDLKKIMKGFVDFFSNLEIDTIAFAVGSFYWMHSGKKLTKGIIQELLVKKLGLTSLSVNAFVTVTTSIVFVGGLIKEAMEERFDTSDWNVGEWIYNTIKTSIDGYLKDFQTLGMNIYYALQESEDGSIGKKIYDSVGVYFDETDWTDMYSIMESALKAVYGNIISWWSGTGFGSWFSEYVAPYFSDTNWNDKYSVMISAMQMVWGNLLNWWSGTGFGVWFNENVAPYFEETNWSSMYSIIRSAMEAVWGNLVKWWEGTAIYNWYNNSVKPWFDLEKWTEMYSTIKTALNNVWDELVAWWNNTAIYRWYNDNVKPWFDVDKWTFSGIKEGLEKAFNAAVDAMKSIWNSFANWLNEALTFSFEGLELPNGETIAAFEVSLGKLPTFYNGGYVPTSYSMFMAGENGVPELLGTVGGRTAVAGGAEITGIREEIRSTGEAETTLLRTAVELLQVIAAKDPNTYLDSRELLSGLNERNIRNGYAF